MTLIKCPECNHEISNKANVCPNCGFVVNTKKPKMVRIDPRDRPISSAAGLEPAVIFIMGSAIAVVIGLGAVVVFQSAWGLLPGFIIWMITWYYSLKATPSLK
ncbi:MAG: zinc-ribbon domain-containing protein [Methanobacterium sp.]|jgi:RNA polymerase subunit RPABC4/transcription elongation factor Spt4